MPAFNFKDLTGQQFGLWTVIKRDTEKEQLYRERTGKAGTAQWLCRCACGKLQSIPSGNLIQGKSTGCRKCKSKTPDNFSDLTGQKFNRLQVLERDFEYHTNTPWIAYWKCQCDCGNIITVASSKLTTGHTKSCGCLQRESAHNRFKDITGQRFGMLTVTSFGFIQKKVTYWHCKCDCGTELIVRSGKLITGHTQSCGCIKSLGEYRLSKLLTENNIPFKKELSFDNLKSEKGRKLRYDFGIFDTSNNLIKIIEFDGTQHFYPVFGTSRERSQYLHECDLLKNKYCFDNNIKLIRIPFTQVNNLSMSLLDDTGFVLTRENEKSYYDQFS